MDGAWVMIVGRVFDGGGGIASLSLSALLSSFSSLFLTSPTSSFMVVVFSDGSVCPALVSSAVAAGGSLPGRGEIGIDGVGDIVFCFICGRAGMV